MNQNDPVTNSDGTRTDGVKADGLIGVTIDDKDRIESKLGEGGMGAVYLATRLMIGDTVAIKVLHSDLGIVLYEMLSGSVPFNSPSLTGLLMQHVNQTPPSLRAVGVRTSAAIERAVLRAPRKAARGEAANRWCARERVERCHMRCD